MLQYIISNNNNRHCIRKPPQQLSTMHKIYSCNASHKYPPISTISHHYKVNICTTAAYHSNHQKQYIYKPPWTTNQIAVTLLSSKSRQVLYQYPKVSTAISLQPPQRPQWPISTIYSTCPSSVPNIKVGWSYILTDHIAQFALLFISTETASDTALHDISTQCHIATTHIDLVQHIFKLQVCHCIT